MPNSPSYRTVAAFVFQWGEMRDNATKFSSVRYDGNRRAILAHGVTIVDESEVQQRSVEIRNES